MCGARLVAARSEVTRAQAVLPHRQLNRSLADFIYFQNSRALRVQLCGFGLAAPPTDWPHHVVLLTAVVYTTTTTISIRRSLRVEVVLSAHEQRRQRQRHQRGGGGGGGDPTGQAAAASVHSQQTRLEGGGHTGEGRRGRGGGQGARGGGVEGERRGWRWRCLDWHVLQANAAPRAWNITVNRASRAVVLPALPAPAGGFVDDVGHERRAGCLSLARGGIYGGDVAAFEHCVYPSRRRVVCDRPV